MFLIGVYLAESVAIAMGMGIPVFSVALALLWGAVFASRLKDCDSQRDVLRTTFFLSLYSSLPMMSFLVVPVALSIAGWDVLSSEAGVRFGIPEFLPWPSDTILGFYVILVAGAVTLKTGITMWMVGTLLRRWNDPSFAS
jgi:hypothetical protein